MPSFTPAELRKLKDAFNAWAKNIPDPDKPIIDFGHGSLSATQLAKAVEDETEDGKSMILIVENATGLTGGNIDRAVEILTRHSPPNP